MAGTITGDGVRMDHVRACSCGRRPRIVTTCAGQEPGFGPFIISCHCDKDPEGEDTIPHFVRSWSKTRAARLWNGMVRDRIARQAVAPAQEAREAPCSVSAG